MKIIINNQSDLPTSLVMRLIMEISIKNDLKTTDKVFHDYTVGESSYTVVFHRNKQSVRFNIYNSSPQKLDKQN